MKKIIKSFILFITLFFPVGVFAREGIDNYYIDATVLQNGDVNVKELFILNGEYNGYERILNYKNSNSVVFSGKESDLNGSSIYDGDSIEINEVKGIDIDGKIDFSYLKKDGNLFEKSLVPLNSGIYGKYFETVTNDGIKIKIYNPSSYNNAFYIDYTIKNMAVLHNDVAELGFNIFSDQQTEFINLLEMFVHLPNNKNELRAWGHGPLTGTTENVDKENVKLTINNIESNTALDIRTVFDKEVIVESNKKTNMEALSKIVNLETIKADEANKLREQARKNMLIRIVITLIVDTLILFVSIYLVFKIYKKYDKEYTSEFKMTYFRDIPSHIAPTSLGYLLNHNIGNDDLSASILKLINENVISCEDKKTLNLVTKYNLSVIDTQLVNWIFNDKETVTFDELKKKAKNNYNSFLSGYSLWHGACEKEAISQNYYENNSGKITGIMFCSIGLIISILFSILNYGNVLFPFTFLFSIAEFIFIVYFSTIRKRTKDANEEYRKWLALKKFMIDFGNFSEKELPEIHLWNEYLVYAVSLGCSNKLAESMKLKLLEMNEIDTTVNQNLDIIFNNLYISNFINNQMNSFVSMAKYSKNQAEIASSSNSSGGGFGGGFSSGGGSFGGGGGGGRF